MKLGEHIAALGLRSQQDNDIVYAAPTDEIHDLIRVGLCNIAKIMLMEQATEVVPGMCGPARDSLTPVAVIVEHCLGMISMQHSSHSIFVRSNLLATGEALSTAYMILILGLNSS